MKAIPTVKGHPLVGNLFQLTSSERIKFLCQSYIELGAVYRLKVLHRDLIVLAGPEANKLMMKHGATYFRSREFWQPTLDVFGASDSLIAADGAVHAYFRKTQQRGYAASSLNRYFRETLELSCKEVTTSMQQGYVGVHYAMQRLIASQIGFLATGMRDTPWLEDVIYFVRTYLSVVVSRQRPRFLLRTPKYKRAKARAFALGQELIATTPIDKDNFVGDVLRARRDRPDIVPENSLLISVLGPFIAGLDTAASSLAFMLYHLADKADLRAQVQREADDFFAQGDFDTKSLSTMTMTYRIALETLRLHPVAGVLNRTSTQNFTFAGYEIPAEHTVLTATTATHFLEEFFPQPYIFDTDRYTNERKEHRQVGIYAPFGLGPHTCLGTGLANALILFNIAFLFHHYTIDFQPNDYQLKIDPVPTIKPNKDFKLALRPRS